MVAVIAGNGLGLDNTSLQKLGGTSGGAAQVGQGKGAGYVNLANGNLVLQGSDEGLVFAGTQLSFIRTYNSQGQLAGQDWRYGFSQAIGAVSGTVNTAGSSVVRTDSDGSSTTYTYDATRGLYVSTNQSGTEDTLSWNASSAQWTWTDGATLQNETYNADGVLTALSNPETGSNFTFTYSNGLLTQIRAADGDMLTLGYDGSGHLTSLTVSAVPAGGGAAVTRQQVSYGYDAQGRLTSVTTSLDSDSQASSATYTTTYDYDGTSDRIAKVTQSDGTIVAYQYTQDAAGDYQVTTVTTGTGAAQTHINLSYAAGQTTLTDANGKAWVYAVDAQGNLVSVTAPPLVAGGTGAVTTYSYDPEGNLIQSTDGNGASTTYVYDPHGNLTRMQDATGHVVTYAYDANDQLTSTTTWTGAAQGQPGDSGYVAPTGAETTYYVRDSGERIAFTVDPTGAVTQNIYAAGLNGATVLASTVTYRGVNFNASGYSVSNPPTAQNLSAWVASSPVQAALSQASRADNIYSASGELLQQTSYDTVTASGAGIVDAGTVIHKTTYDAQGQLRQSVTMRGQDRTVSEQTSYAYDGMGRLLGSVDALGNATAYIYDDANNGIAVYQANGLVTSTFRNSAGQIISVVQGTSTAPMPLFQTLETPTGPQLIVDSTLLYDANGRQIVSIDANGAATFTFYDSQGRVAGTVSASGVETAYQYDAQGNRTTQTIFATNVSTTGWLNDRSLGTAYPTSLPSVTAVAADQTTRTVFDASGHVVASVAPDGTVTANGFDTSGNEVWSTVYATKLTASQMTALGNAPSLAQVQADITNTSTDLTTLWVFNGGFLAATVAPNNTVTQYTRDAAGNVTLQRVYFKPLTSAQRTTLGKTPTYAALHADLQTNIPDRLTLTFYDANERVAATVDENHNVVLYHYNANGQLASQTIVATPITTTQRNALVTNPSLATLLSDVSLGDTGGNYLKVFNGSDLYATVTADGHVTTYTFDYAHNMTSMVVRATVLTAAQLADLGTEPTPGDIRDMVTSTPQDQITLYLRDSSSSIIATVIPVAQYTTSGGVTTLSYGGQISTNTYNSYGQVVVTTVYNTQLTAAQVLALYNNSTQAKINSSVTRSAFDQTSFWLYDDHDRLAAIGTPVNGADGNGTQFVVNSFDTSSNLLTSITHATALTQTQAAALAGTATLAKLNTYLTSGASDFGSILIYDSSNRVVASISGTGPTGEAVTLTTYDTSGRPFKVQHFGAMLTAAQFDALIATPTMAKLNTTLPPAGTVVATGSSYDYTTYAANGKPSITLVSQLVGGAWQGLLTAYQYDAAGNATSVTTYAPVSGSALSTFNQSPSATALQTLLSGATSNGTTWTAFDGSGNVVATVSPTGTVQTWTFDASNRQQVARTYTQPLTSAAMASLGSSPTLSQILAALPANDPSTSTINVFDDAGHLLAHVDASGHVTVNIYDPNGYLQSTTAYATALTAPQQTALGDHPTAASIQAAVSSSSSDVTTYQLHDGAGHLLATIDASGNVTVMAYDAAGHQISQVQYATALTAAQRTSYAQNQTLSNLQGLVSTAAGDLISVSVYDAAGHLAATAVNGVVTLITSDSTGNALNTVTVTDHLNMDQMRALAAAPTLDAIMADLSLQAGNTDAQTIYDASGNALATVSSSGHVVVMTYDASGHRMSVIDYGSPLPSDHGYYGSVAALYGDIPNAGAFTLLTLFNAAGQTVATVDQAGKTTLYQYDSSGHLTGTSHYDTNMTAAQQAAMASAPTLETLQGIFAPSTGGGGTDPGDGGTGPNPGGGTGTAPTTGRITHILYDAAGRPAATIDPTGAISFSFYDADGRLSASVDPDGYVTAYTYDGAGQVVASTVYATRVDTSPWTVAGALSGTFPSSITPTTSGNDRTSLTVYDTAGRVVATMDGAGDVITRTFDGAGNVISQTAWANPFDGDRQALGLNPSLTAITNHVAASTHDRTTVSTFDADNRLTASVDADGFVTTYAYDNLGNVTKTITYATALLPQQWQDLKADPTSANPASLVVTSASDETTRNFYDGTGRLTASVDAAGYLSCWAYDEAGHTMTVTRHASALSPAQINALTGNETEPQLVAMLPGTTGDQATVTAYDAVGRISSVTGPDGTVTSYTYTYDATGGETRGTSVTSLGTTWSSTTHLDQFGETTSAMDAAGQASTATFDNDGRITSRTDATGNTTYLFYDNDGRVLYQVQGQPGANGAANGKGDVVFYTYDAFGELLQTVRYAATLSLNATQTVNTSTIDLSVATLVNVTAAVNALIAPAGDANEVESASYDAAGRQILVTDGNGYQTGTAYDAFGEVTSVSQQYTAANSPWSAANSHTTTSQYDNRGNLIGQTRGAGEAGASTASATFDAFGNEASATDAMGSVTTYTHDALNRLVATSQTVNGAALSSSTTFDAFGRAVTSTDAAGAVTHYSYNVAARSMTVTSPEGVVVTTVTDILGDTVSVSDGAGNTTTYTYDGDGRLTGTTTPANEASHIAHDVGGTVVTSTDALGRKVVTTYDANQRILSRVVDPGQGGLNLTTTYQYDGIGRVLSQIVDPAGADLVTTYQYNSEGQLQSSTDPSGATTSFTYDGSGNVLTQTSQVGSGESVTTYTWDAQGRKTSSTVDSGNLNLTTTYAYDADGHMVQSGDPAGTFTYFVYDQAGRLVYSIAPAGAQGGSQGRVTQYTYDGDGRQLSSRTFATLISTSSLTTLPTMSTTAALGAVAGLVSADATHDLQSFNVLDADGRVRFAIDADGGVVEYRFNALGQLSELLAYPATVTVSASLSSALRAGTATAADITSALTSAGDTEASASRTFNFYDTDGQLRFAASTTHINGADVAAVTETRYDADGEVSGTVVYGSTLTLAQVGSGATTASIAAALASATDKRTTSTLYDKAGRVRAQVAADGTASFVFYDGAGRISATVDNDGAVVAFVYNGAGRVSQQTAFLKTVDTSTWISGGVVVPTDAASILPEASSAIADDLRGEEMSDRVTTFTYDGVGNLLEKRTVLDDARLTGSSGYVSELVQDIDYTYDGAGRVVSSSVVDEFPLNQYPYPPDNVRTTQYLYDADGRRIGTVDPLGNRVQSDYDAAGNLVRTTQYAGPIEGTGSLDDVSTWSQSSSANDRVTQYYYDGLGRNVGQLDANDYLTVFSYNGNGALTNSTRYTTALTGHQGDSFAALQALVAGTAHRSTQQTFDALGRLVSATNAEGTVTSYVYDIAGNLLSTTVAAGTSDAQTTSNTFDAYGDAITTTDGEGRVTTSTYDVEGRKASSTDGLGNTTWYVYDGEGQLTYSVTGVPTSQGVNTLGELNQYQYDAFGELVSTVTYAARFIIGSNPSFTMTSVAQIAATMVADAGGFLENAASATSATLYDTEGNVIVRTNGNGRSTYFGYDAFGEMVFDLVDNQSHGASGYGGSSVTLYSYDDAGNLTGETQNINEVFSNVSAFIDTSMQAFNTWHQIHGFRSPALDAADWTFSYDAFGDRTDSVNGDSVETSYAYDGLGQLMSTDLHMAAGDRVTGQTWDAYGRMLTSVDGDSNTTTYAYDDVNRTVTRSTADGQVQVTTHNREGQVTSVVNAAGQGTQVSYDQSGRVHTSTDALGNVTTTVYDAAGNIASVTDARGSVTHYTYGAAGRVATETVDQGGLALVTTYTYDTAGHAIDVLDAAGDETTYSYDRAGNMTLQVKDPNGADVETSYSYDAEGRVTNESGPDGTRTYIYDGLGRLVASQDPGGFAYTTYNYDAAGHLVRENGKDGTTYYVNNEAGQVELTIRSGIYGNDPLSTDTSGYGLLGAVTRNYYDGAGNLVATRAYDKLISMAPLNGNFGPSGDSTESEQLSIYKQVIDQAASSDDRVTYTVFGPGNQPRFTIDATGVVTEYRYNTLGEMTETLVYGTRLVPASVTADELSAGTFSVSDMTTALGQAGATEAAATRTYAYYDADGRTRFTVVLGTVGGVSGGIVNETRYDADGNAVTAVSYGSVLTATNFATATTASLASAVSSLPARVTQTIYDGAGRPVYTVDSLNHVTEQRYDGDGRVLWTLSYLNAIPAGTALTLAAVSAAVQAANGVPADIRASGQDYDAAGQVIHTYNALGGAAISTSGYDDGQLASVTDAEGNVTTYDYSGGLLRSKTSAEVGVDQFGTVSQLSFQTFYQYDQYGRLGFTQTSAGENSATTDYEYDQYGNQTQVTTQNSGEDGTTTSGQTLVTYDAFNQAVFQRDASGRTEWKVYDADGRLAFDIDASGFVTGYTYDTNGNQATVTRYANAVNPTSLDQDDSYGVRAHEITIGQVESLLTTSASDRSITTTFDALGNKTSVVQSAVTYTKADGSTATGQPTTVYTYNAFGDVTSEATLMSGVAGQAGAVWATTYHYYDTAGRETLTVDPMGYVTQTTYDGFGDVASTTQYAHAISTSGLTAGGTPPGVPTTPGDATSGFDRVTTYTYDQAGRKHTQSDLVTVTAADGSTSRQAVTTTWGYDGEGRTTSVDVDGKTVTTAYDGMGRIISVTSPSQKVLRDNWQALLDANPTWNLSNAALYMDSSEVITYTYDALGYKASEVHTATGSTLVQATYYVNDGDGNPTQVISTVSGADREATDVIVRNNTYDKHHNLVSSTYTLSGNDGSTQTVTVTNTYDDDDHLTHTRTVRSGGTTDVDSYAQINAFGETTGTGVGDATTVVATYDAAGRMTSATDPKTGAVHTYTYDLAGNMRSDTVATTGGAGSAVTSYVVDLDGRVTSEKAPSASAASGSTATATTASYDRWGNVLSSTDFAGNTTTYEYDERNHVVLQSGPAVTVVSDTGSSLTQTPTVVTGYDAQGNVIRSVDANGNVTVTSVNAVGQVIGSINGAGDQTLVGYDALGNEVADQDGIGHITFKNVDGQGRIVQQGDFVLSANGQSRSAVWQEAYVLDENGNRLRTYDGIGSAYLQAGDQTNADLHANFYGYDSQGRVLWSQDPVQRSNSTSSGHGGQTWTQVPFNGGFEAGATGWSPQPGWAFNGGGETGLGATFVKPASGNSGLLYNNDVVPVIPGQVITAQVDVTQGTSSSGDAGAWVEIIWYNAAGAQIGVSDGNHITSSTGGWQPSSIAGTAPAGAAYARLAVVAFNNTSDPLTVDNAGWNYVPPAGAQNNGQGGVIGGPGGTLSQTQLPNPDFENGSTGWVTNNWTWVGFGESGSKGAMGLTGSANTQLVSTARVPVTANQSITASIAVQQGAAAAHLAGAQVAIYWYDASGNLISTSLGNLIDSGSGGSWQGSSVTATAPAGAAYASMGAVGFNNTGSVLLVDSANWTYQYVAPAPTGVIQTQYTYDLNGNLIAETDADNNNETWSYDAYNRVTAHTDLSGAAYTYTYDAASGLLTGESDNWSAQDQTLPGYLTGPITTPNQSARTYYANGQLATLTYADGSSYSYSYDANGNMTREESTTHDGNNVLVHTITATTYDSHNRISTVTETNAVTGTVTSTIAYDYDANGNRRHVHATSSTASVATDGWYTYDGANRVAVTGGQLVNNTIVVAYSLTSESYALTYDHAGNAVTRTTLASQGGDQMMVQSVFNARSQLVQANYARDMVNGTGGGVEETRQYDADGRLIITDHFYAPGTSAASKPTGKTDPDNPPVDEPGVAIGGDFSTATVDHYDAAGHLFVEQNYGHDANWDGTGGSAAVPTGVPGVDDAAYGSLSLQNKVTYQGVDGTGGYDAVGNAIAYQYEDSTGRIDQYNVAYYLKDGYLEAATSGLNITNTPNVRPASDQSFYDDRGNRVAIVQHTQANGGQLEDDVRIFAYDGYGQIIERRDGTAAGSTFSQGTNTTHENQHYVYVNGQQVAHYDEGGTLDVLDQVTGFANTDAGTSGYVVQAGDTLHSIAQAVYGNASYWYIIAQANALSNDNDLAIGQTLNIPQVSTSANTSTTFKPYNPAEISGSTTPNLPTIAPPPIPSAHHCNALAAIVIIAVIVVATIVTAGAAAAVLAPAASGVAGASAFSAGLAVLGGSAGLSAGVIGAAFVGGVAGNLAGQVAGDAFGTHQGISAGEAFVGGFTTAATAGIGGAFAQGAGEFSPFATSTTATSVSLTPLGAAVEGAGSYVSSVIADHIVGQRSQFSWAGLAAASIASGLTSEIGLKTSGQPIGTGNGSFGADVASAIIRGGINRETSRFLGDDRVSSYEQIGEDAFGNAVGNKLVKYGQDYESDLPPVPLDNSISVAPDLTIQVGGYTPQLDVVGINQAVVPYDLESNLVPPGANTGSGSSQPSISYSGGDFANVSGSGLPDLAHSMFLNQVNYPGQGSAGLTGPLNAYAGFANTITTNDGSSNSALSLGHPLAPVSVAPGSDYDNRYILSDKEDEGGISEFANVISSASADVVSATSIVRLSSDHTYSLPNNYLSRVHASSAESLGAREEAIRSGQLDTAALIGDYFTRDTTRFTLESINSIEDAIYSTAGYNFQDKYEATASVPSLIVKELSESGLLASDATEQGEQIAQIQKAADDKQQSLGLFNTKDFVVKTGDLDVAVGTLNALRGNSPTFESLNQSSIGAELFPEMTESFDSSLPGSRQLIATIAIENSFVAKYAVGYSIASVESNGGFNTDSLKTESDRYIAAVTTHSVEPMNILDATSTILDFAKYATDVSINADTADRASEIRVYDQNGVRSFAYVVYANNGEKVIPVLPAQDTTHSILGYKPFNDALQRSGRAGR